MKKLPFLPIFLFIFAIAASAFTCSVRPTENLTNSTQKPIMITDNYDDAWRVVDSLDRERLPQSAQEQVEKIYKKAQLESNYPQVVKTIIYRSKYVSQLEEEGMAKVIANWEEEIKNADAPTKQILQSVLAQVVDSYRQSNSWRLQNRTETQDYDNQDIKTWTSEQLTDYSLNLYLASLEKSNISKAQPFTEFQAITTNGNTAELRPTLYDFLAHRAIDFFMNERNYLTQPAYKFELDNPAVFAYTNEFINTDFPTKDKDSFKKITLDLFQDLLRFKMKTNNSDALADVELKRLKFVYNNAVMTDKDDLYLSALEKLYSKHEEDKTAGEILYNIGAWHQSKGNSYNLDDPAKSSDLFKNGLVKALSYYEQILEKYPKTLGATKAGSSINNLKNKNFSLNAEQVSLANEPILVAISYKNTSKVYVKIIPWNETKQDKLTKLLRERREYDNDVADYVNSLESQQNANYNLEGTEDLRQHSTEIAFAGLPLGEYMVIAGSDADFSVNRNFISYTKIVISNLGYWVEVGNGNQDNRNFFTAYNRKTGAPESGVKVEFYKREYNSVFRKNEYKKSSETSSDKDGFFSSNVPLKGRNNSSYNLKLTKGNDVLFLENTYYDNQYRDRNQSTQFVQFFTDRAIYRPGQTVYFKGIFLNKDKDRMPSIAPNKKVQVIFRDANWQEIAKTELTSNEYGTFNGSFSAPAGGLLGSMQIEVPRLGSKSIRVEEYKRPKFEVKFEPVKGSFALNDSVKIEGKGLAYAGNNIDGADVKYRVTRQARYPYRPWWYWRGGNQPSSPEMEISNGTTKTDAAGKFSITFKAIPDPNIPAKDKPVFTYTVIADVTDITGETHTSTQGVQVGYIALKASADIKDEIEAQDLKSITLNTKNLNGEFEAAQGTFELNLLKAPTRTFINRYWERPEFKTISQADFLKKFPHLAYDEEDKSQNWEVERSVISTDFDTEKSKEIAIGKIKLVPGKYRAILKTKDKNGTPIKWEKLVTIIDLEADNIAFPKVAWHFKKDLNHEPGETAKVYFGTAEKNTKILFSVIKDKKVISRKWLTVNDLLSEKIKIEESDRGNFFYLYNYAKHNRSHNGHNTIKVPWSNKDLQIEYTTFRDKLLPGQDEEWQIKISGQKGDKVAAEMLATMYDASLDAFAKNSFSLNPYPTSSYSGINVSSPSYRQVSMNPLWRTWQERMTINPIYKTYHNLNLFGFSLYENRNYLYETVTEQVMRDDGGFGAVDKKVLRSAATTRAMPQSAPAMKNEAFMFSANAMDSAESIEPPRTAEPPPPPSVEEIGEETTEKPLQIRENLKETVFFYPDLMTDAEGNIIVKFKMNEALTRWKFLGIATTKDLQIGTTEKEIVTQKELMVVPNAPRFFRENDEIEFTAKVVNLSEKDLSGTANMELLNPLNGEPVFVDADFPQDFTVKAGQSARLAWYFNVPEVSEVPVIQHTISAKAGNKSDAERSVTPVLTNRMLVTETMPLPVRGGQEKTFTFKSMQEKASSPTLAHEGVTLEFTSNPAWYAVQALPYLMEYPYECTEQIFSRYYANSLATSVANAHPKVKTVFEQWRDREPDALLSNLSKNQELKTALLEETPWVLNAQSEEMQKRNIGLLFDLNKMSNEQAIALRKLKERQLAGGGFAWFPGGRDNWYITQYLVEGLGHLDKLGVADVTQNAGTWQMVQKAVKYCDDRIVEYYEDIEEAVKKGNTKWEDDHLSSIAMHYLYARTFFLQNLDTQANTGESKVQSEKKFIALNGKAQKAFDYFVSQSDTYWNKKNIYNQGMIALALHRINKNETPVKLVKSFKERALNNEEMGMYFKSETGYNWYELPIERHALLIEVMDDVAQDAQAVDDMKTWLLKNKQTNHWKTTKATASAVYALLATGDNWLLETAPVEVGFEISKDNKYNVQIKEAQANAEAGTGYFKTRFDGDEVSDALSNIKVKNPNKSVAWGAMYWQYFEQLDKITTFEDTPLQIKKQLFKVVLTDTGEKITPVNEGDKLSPGDKLKVRIELRTDRSMEYVHMKDGRASGFEPMNVISRYKWQGGLGYYESTRDASTDFFFSRLPKGTHVFEYPVRVVHNGNFSNGITTVQCMYAPEFTSHSEGVRVEVE